MSPLGSDQSYDRYPDYPDPNLRYTPPNHGNKIIYPASSPVDGYGSAKYIDEQNINNNVYILPDQFRGRTLSQGAVRNTSPREASRYEDKPHRPYPNNYIEDERLYRHSQDLQQSEDIKSYPDYRYLGLSQFHSSIFASFSKSVAFCYRYLDNDIQPRSSHLQSDEDFYLQRYPQTFEYQDYRNKTPPQVPMTRQRRDQDTMSVVEGRVPRQTYAVDYTHPGYYVRQNGEIIWYPEDKYIEKLGSLDRRKASNFPEVPSRYHVATCGPKTSTSNMHQIQAPERVIGPNFLIMNISPQTFFGTFNKNNYVFIF